MLSLCYSKPGRPGRILTLDAAPRHAGDDLLSEDQEENQHGYNDDRSAGHLQIHLGAHRIPEVEQTDGQTKEFHWLIKARIPMVAMAFLFMGIMTFQR